MSGRKNPTEYAWIVAQLYQDQHAVKLINKYPQIGKSKSPQLDVQRGSHEFFRGPLGSICVVAVSVEMSNDKVFLLSGQEPPGLVTVLREIHNVNIAEDSDDTCDDTFHDEDPSPCGFVA